MYYPILDNIFHLYYEQGVHPQSVHGLYAILLIFGQCNIVKFSQIEARF